MAALGPRGNLSRLQPDPPVTTISKQENAAPANVFGVRPSLNRTVQQTSTTCSPSSCGRSFPSNQGCERAAGVRTSMAEKQAAARASSPYGTGICLEVSPRQRPGSFSPRVAASTSAEKKPGAALPCHQRTPYWKECDRVGSVVNVDEVVKRGTGICSPRHGPPPSCAFNLAKLETSLGTEPLNRRRRGTSPKLGASKAKGRQAKSPRASKAEDTTSAPASPSASVAATSVGCSAAECSSGSIERSARAVNEFDLGARPEDERRLSTTHAGIGGGEDVVGLLRDEVSSSRCLNFEGTEDRDLANMSTTDEANGDVSRGTTFGNGSAVASTIAYPIDGTAPADTAIRSTPPVRADVPLISSSTLVTDWAVRSSDGPNKQLPRKNSVGSFQTMPVRTTSAAAAPPPQVRKVVGSKLEESPSSQVFSPAFSPASVASPRVAQRSEIPPPSPLSASGAAYTPASPAMLRIRSLPILQPEHAKPGAESPKPISTSRLVPSRSSIYLGATPPQVQASPLSSTAVSSSSPCQSPRVVQLYPAPLQPQILNGTPAAGKPPPVVLRTRAPPQPTVPAAGQSTVGHPGLAITQSPQGIGQHRSKSMDVLPARPPSMERSYYQMPPLVQRVVTTQQTLVYR